MEPEIVDMNIRVKVHGETKANKEQIYWFNFNVAEGTIITQQKTPLEITEIALEHCRMFQEMLGNYGE